jgi:hypothetical protein
MAEDVKPLSTLVSQGWEIVAYANAAGGEQGQMMTTENFLLRRMKAHKIVKIRKKMIGHGFVVTEMDI